MLRKFSNKWLLGAAFLVAFSTACADQPVSSSSPSQPDQEVKSQESKPAFSQEEIRQLSEAFGHFIGRNLINSPKGFKFDLTEIIKGMRNGAEGEPAPMSDQRYEEMMIKMQTVTLNQMAEENLKAANQFLNEQNHADGVVVIEPGKLAYIVLQEGKGATVPEHGAPQVEYSGKFLDGTSFGNSKDSGGPITIPLDQTIPGFSKGIVGMKEGEKRRIFVHPDLGYGKSGHLPPNSLLIFEVEVVKAASPDQHDSLQDSSDVDLEDEADQ